MTSSLPTDVDSSYPDRSPGDAAHQQHHDILHALNNVFHGATEGQRFEKQGGELVAVENGAFDASDLIGWHNFRATSGSPAPGTINNLGVLLFDPNSTEQASAVLKVPAGTWDLAVRWCNSGTAGDDVVWRLDYDVIGPGGTLTRTVGSNTTATAPTTAGQLTDTTLASSVTVANGEVIVASILRVNLAGDTLAVDAGFFGIMPTES